MQKTKVKQLLSGRSLRDWNLIALRNLGGSVHIRRIDARIRDMLRSLSVPESTLDRGCTYDRRTLLQRNLEAARTAAKKNGLLENTKRGHWRLSAKGRSVADELIRNRWKNELARIDHDQRSQAHDQIRELAKNTRVAIGKVQLLQKYPISVDDLEKLLKSRLGPPSVPVTPGPSHSERMEVEKKAIDYIRSREPNVWHTTPPGNPGFDLYQTSESGKKTVWCEVKALSEEFSSVSLTPRESKRR